MCKGRVAPRYGSDSLLLFSSCNKASCALTLVSAIFNVYVPVKVRWSNPPRIRIATI